MQQNLSIKGFVKVDVVDHKGRVVRHGRWQKNLLLDQGLNNLSTVLLCDLFGYAVKGNDTIVMYENITGSNNTYTLDSAAATLTLHASGTRTFVDPDDIGKLGRASTGDECIIVSVASPTVANVRAVGSDTLNAYANRTVDLYSVQATGIATEVDRTNNYSAIPGENATTSSGIVKTFKRTFLFDAEAANEESPASGALLASWTSHTVTKLSGTRPFTNDDEGKYIQFPNGDYAKITTYTDATHVTVDRVPTVTHTGETVNLFGFNSYSHIGFSDLGTAGDNLNILVRLENSPGGTAAPVLALGSNPETPGQQVKVTYTFSVTFGPATITSVAGSFTDPSGVMGGSKSGHVVIEAVTSSEVAADGTTTSDASGLEPSVGGFVGLSNLNSALVALTPTSNPPDRSPGAVYAELTPGTYSPDSFENTYTGTFDITEGNGRWWAFGLYEPSAQEFTFVYLFQNIQTKPGTHQFTFHFIKTWDRDLS